MPRLPQVMGADVLKALERDGWHIVRSRGRYFILDHPDRPGRPVVPVHAGGIIAPGTLKAILGDAGMSVERLRVVIEDMSERGEGVHVEESGAVVSSIDVELPVLA